MVLDPLYKTMQHIDWANDDNNLVNSCPVSLVHLVELVNAADALQI